jgi:hypothetical protein
MKYLQNHERKTMLDQNITTLLAVLLGGLLSLLGSVLVNYYIQTSSKNYKNKKKFVTY